MQALVWALVRSELGLNGQGGASVESGDKQKAFLRVFQQLSSSARSRLGAAESAAVSDLIAQHLQGLRKRTERGLDRSLRFQGLLGRLQHADVTRSPVLVLLFLLRGDAYAGENSRTPLGPQLHMGTSQNTQRPETRLAAGTPGKQVTVGWQVGTGAPAELPEVKLVRDLLFALQGVGSDCCKLDTSFEVDPAVVLSRPAWFLAQRVLEVANLHVRLSTGTIKGQAGSGLLQQALGEALRKQLQDYYEVLALLMSKASGGALSLRGLWTWLLVPLASLRFLASLSEACRGILGGALSSAVFAFAQSGDTMVQETATKILGSVLKPLLAMIRAWMTEGDLQDPFGEFFVVADTAVPLEELWTGMYRLEVEMVPCYMTLELARKILLTGKSVNFIRLCCPGHRWSAPSTRFLSLPGDPHEDLQVEIGAGGKPLVDLALQVESAARQTNEHLVKLLMEQFALGEHALALRRFLLLGQGDFVESLMDAAQEELSGDASTLHRHQLTGILDMALRQSNAQFCPADVLARLGVKLLSPSSGECGWDIFLLDYSIDSPLHVVFTPAAMQKYDRAFLFLWKLRRVSHTLAASWNQHMALQRHLVSCPAVWGKAPELRLEMRQTLHRCTCLRNELHHFVQNIQAYVMFEVLDTAWAKLRAGWETCADLDEVIAQHERYLAGIEDGAFLARGREAVLSAITTLLTLALDFCSLQDQACASSFEAAEAMMEAEAEEAEVASVFQAVRSQPFARSLAECRAQLDGLASTFTTKLQLFLQSLEEQPEQGVFSDYGFLCSRLDFNGYYEQKRGLE